MSNLKKCDRCGDVSETSADMDAPFGWVTVNDEFGGHVFDLCGKCSVAFDKWRMEYRKEPK